MRASTSARGLLARTIPLSIGWIFFKISIKHHLGSPAGSHLMPLWWLHFYWTIVIFNQTNDTCLYSCKRSTCLNNLCVYWVNILFYFKISIKYHLSSPAGSHLMPLWRLHFYQFILILNQTSGKCLYSCESSTWQNNCCVFWVIIFENIYKTPSR